LKHNQTTEETQERATLYALGALSQHEARAFEVHLREGCPVCQTEISRYESVTADLGLAAPAAAPPPYLRELLTARLEREAGPPAPAPADDAGTPLSTPKPAPSSVGLYLPWAVAVCFAALFAFSYRAVRQNSQDVARQQERLVSLQDEAEQLKASLAQEKMRMQQLDQIRSVLSSPGSRVILLVGQDPAPSASGAVLWDTQRNRWLVTASLPPPPAGKVYQLWFVTAAQAKKSAALIRTDGTGQSFTSVDVPSDVTRQLATAAITLEPEGGSEQPTMPIYLLGRAG